MENTRETKEITTPIGKAKVELKTYITGREKQSIYEKVSDIQNNSIRNIVVAVNESKEKIVDNILDLHGKDYDFVINAITGVLQESSFLAPEKKES